jgi:DNA-binding SARP family transcriptional activator
MQLCEQWRSTSELLARLRLEQDDPAEAIRVLAPVAASAPLRESVIELLMRARYAAGEQATALRTYDRFRRDVGQQAGLEPSPRLVELERAIARHVVGPTSDAVTRRVSGDPR